MAACACACAYFCIVFCEFTIRLLCCSWYVGFWRGIPRGHVYSLQLQCISSHWFNGILRTCNFGSWKLDYLLAILWNHVAVMMARNTNYHKYSISAISNTAPLHFLHWIILVWVSYCKRERITWWIWRRPRREMVWMKDKTIFPNNLFQCKTPNIQYYLVWSVDTFPFPSSATTFVLSAVFSVPSFSTCPCVVSTSWNPFPFRDWIAGGG